MHGREGLKLPRSLADYNSVACKLDTLSDKVEGCSVSAGNLQQSLHSEIRALRTEFLNHEEIKRDLQEALQAKGQVSEQLSSRNTEYERSNARIQELLNNECDLRGQLKQNQADLATALERLEQVIHFKR